MRERWEAPVVGLSDIAAGIEVTHEQRDPGVTTVDGTGGDLADRLAPHGEDLPCDPTAAARVLSAYGGGESVGAAADEAGVAPVTAAKTLHLLGVEGVSPLSPTGREICRDWVAGRLPRAEARELAGASETAFALAAFVETHDPLDGTAELVERVLSEGREDLLDKREYLGETMSDVDDLL